MSTPSISSLDHSALLTQQQLTSWQQFSQQHPDSFEQFSQEQLTHFKLALTLSDFVLTTDKTFMM